MITYILIAIIVVVSFYAYSRPDMMMKFMMTPYLIQKRNEYYRFLASGFIHKDHMHLLLNMFSFYFFGTAVEQVFNNLFGRSGSIYLIALFLLGIIASDIPTYFKHRNNPSYHALGASGGVSAVIFAFIIFQPLQNICIYFALCMPGFILGTLYIGFSYYQGRKSNDGINHDAHLYGALFGLVFCIIVYPSSIPNFFQQVLSWRIF